MIHPKYTNYFASNYGRIKHITKKGNEKLNKLTPNGKNGYLCFHISNKKLGINNRPLVHRFCYEAFHQVVLPKGHKDLEINHKNENKTDNRVFENLELVTPKQNANWGTRNERIAEALTKQVEQYDLEGNLIKIWESTYQAEREGNFIRSNISDCCRGKRKTHKGFIWKHIEEGE